MVRGGLELRGHGSRNLGVVGRHGLGQVGSAGVETCSQQGGHVATEAAPILCHLFGAEFGLEILLELGKDFFITFF